MSNSEQKKQASLVALMNSNTLSEAAEKAGIDRRTLYNYLHNDIDFAKAFRELRSQQAVALMDTVNEYRERASRVILDIMDDKDQPAAVRLKAAQTLLSVIAVQDEQISTVERRNIERNSPLGVFDFS